MGGWPTSPAAEFRADGYSLRVFVQRRVAPGESGQVAHSAQGDVFTYAYWSPADCPGDGCRDLAVLYTPANGNGLEMRLLRNEGDTTREWATERGSPFYYSFSPDGKHMLWHRFETQIELYDVERRRLQDLEDRPGTFSAPMWAPQGEQMLIAVRGTQAGASDITLAEGERRTPLLRNQPSPVSFAFSPDGQQAAVLNGNGALTVLDIASKEVIASRTAGIILAFFWAPDSQQLAYVSLPRDDERSVNLRPVGALEKTQSAQNRLAISISLLDPGAQSSTLLGSYQPTDDMIYYLQFFDQFSRSHSLWSPDGQYFAFGGLDAQNHPAVILFDTHTPGDTKTIPDSTVGIWSWH